MIDNQMTCAECDEMFLDYFEDTLDGESLSRFNEHTSTCVRCQGLIRDVGGIRAQASSLQDLAPSRDLWSGIDARIQPEVRSIAARSGGALSRRWLAAAAAALVVATSSVTYYATSRSINKLPVVAVVPPKAVAPTQVGPVPEPASTTPSEEPAVIAAAPTAPSVPQTRTASTAGRTPPRASLASSTRPTASESAFSGEINQLQSVLMERRAQLDPETVKIVEDNLKLIDTAVQRARSALLKDPASGFLTRQLDNALQKKIELLRTVALMPSST